MKGKEISISLNARQVQIKGTPAKEGDSSNTNTDKSSGMTARERHAQLMAQIKESAGSAADKEHFDKMNERIAQEREQIAKDKEEREKRKGSMEEIVNERHRLANMTEKEFAAEKERLAREAEERKINEANNSASETDV